MKKLLTALLCLCICFSLAACAGQAEAKTTPGPAAAEPLPARTRTPNQFVDIAVCEDTTALLRADGTIRLVGAGDTALLPDAYADWTAVRDLAVVYDGMACADENGRVHWAPFYGDERPELDDWTNVASLAASGNCLLGLRKDGTVLCSNGGDGYGEVKSARNGELLSWKSVDSLAAGSGYAAAILQNGTVRVSSDAPASWHEEAASWQKITRLAVGEVVLAGLCKDGTVKAAGCSPEDAAVIAGWKNVKDVAVLQNCVLAIDENGRLLRARNAVPEYYYEGDLGAMLDASKDWDGLSRLFTGGSNLFALRGDGRALACGDSWQGNCDVEDWTGITAISVYESVSLGLRADGTVVGVGGGDYGKILTGSWTGVKGVSSDCGLDAQGRLFTNDRWAAEQYAPDMRDWTDVVQLAGHVGLRRDGRILLSEDSYDLYAYEEALSWRDITAIAQGDDFLLGLNKDGTVSLTGECESLAPYGDPNAEQRIRVACSQIRGWKDVTAVSAGAGHALALKADGTVEAVGCGDEGQCDVSAWREIVAVAAGGNFSVGLRADGTVVTCGKVGYYDPLDLSDWTGVTAIAAGRWHVLGLRADGTVLAGGSHMYGACNT